MHEYGFCGISSQIFRRCSIGPINQEGLADHVFPWNESPIALSDELSRLSPIAK
jgi:hypothetical protein